MKWQIIVFCLSPYFKSFLYMCVFNKIQLFAWTVACQAPPHGIFQATILKGVAISSSRRCSWPRDWTQLSCVSCVGKGFFITEPPGKLFCKVYWWLYDAISHSLFLTGYYCYFPLGNEKLETHKNFHFQYGSKSSAIQLHHKCSALLILDDLMPLRW